MNSHGDSAGVDSGVAPELAAFLTKVGGDGLPNGAAFGSVEGTAFLERRRNVRRPARTLLPVGSVEDLRTPGGVAVRLYKPTGPVEAAPLVVYLHGGGWATGDLDMHDPTCRILCARADAIVVNVDYRLAPENPFPAGLNDCIEAVEWARSRAGSWGCDPARMVVAGTSAGANLAAAVAVRRRDEGRPDLAAMVLIYPVLDATMDSVSYTVKANGYFLTAAEMRFFWDAYVPDHRDRRHPWLSPGLVNSLDGLPPTVVITAEHDPLHDEGVAFAQRLGERQLLICAYDAPGQIHGFMTVFPDASATQRALNVTVDAIRATRPYIPE